jgi:hypothetical protein
MGKAVRHKSWEINNNALTDAGLRAPRDGRAVAFCVGSVGQRVK